MEPVEAAEAEPSARWSRADWQVAAGIALLLAAAPIATWAGAILLRPGVEAQVEVLRAQADPRIRADRDAARGRQVLRALLREPALGTAIDRLAAALPDGSQLVRAERKPDGALAVDIFTPDPDRLRSALRREPILAGLRDRGQRRSEAGMVVTLESAQ